MISNDIQENSDLLEYAKDPTIEIEKKTSENIIRTKFTIAGKTDFFDEKPPEKIIILDSDYVKARDLFSEKQKNDNQIEALESQYNMIAQKNQKLRQELEQLKRLNKQYQAETDQKKKEHQAEIMKFQAEQAAKDKEAKRSTHARIEVNHGIKGKQIEVKELHSQLDELLSKLAEYDKKSKRDIIQKRKLYKEKKAMCEENERLRVEYERQMLLSQYSDSFTSAK